MRKMITMCLFAGILLALTSCEPKDESAKAVALDTKGSLVINHQLTPIDNAGFVLTSTVTVHDMAGNVVKTIVTNDTLPFLGMTKDTLSYVKYAGTDNEEERDTIVTHPRLYQLFISAKK